MGAKAGALSPAVKSCLLVFNFPILARRTGSSIITSTSRLALQNPYSPSERIAAFKTSKLHEIVDIMAPPDRTTEAALYVAKLDNGTRRTMVEALDPVTQNVLASRLVDETINSDYVRFGIRGHVQLRVTKMLGENGAETDSPAFSGVFFGRQASAPPPWSLSLDPSIARPVMA